MGLRVFLTIADRGEIRADELRTLLETPLSTVYRYLRTLTEFGFVERMEGGYRLGQRLHLTGGTTVSSEELIRHADPILRMLVDEAGETAVIARRVGLTAVCLHEVQSGHALRVTCEPGSATPLVSGALAKVLLAYAPAEIQDEVLAEVVQRQGVATRARDRRGRRHRSQRGRAVLRHRGPWRFPSCGTTGSWRPSGSSPRRSGRPCPGERVRAASWPMARPRSRGRSANRTARVAIGTIAIWH